MNYLAYQLDNGYLNRFITTGTYIEPQIFEKTVLSGKVNEWLEKGFSIHENPCRGQFIEAREHQLPEYIDMSRNIAGDEIQVFGQKRELSVYYPFGNQGLDFSEFYFNPTYLRSYNYASLLVEHEEKAEFSLETCGGVTLWVNGELITDFIPFTRNRKNECRVSIALKKGFNKILVCLDDLAERDTDYYFRMRYLGENHLKICLPVPLGLNTEIMWKIEQMLSEGFFDREVYISEPVVLNLVNPLHYALEIQVSYKPVADKISHAETLVVQKRFQMKPGERKLELFHADQVIPGFYYIKVKAGINGVWAEKTIATQVFHKSLLVKRETTPMERKKEALCYLRDVEVDNVYKSAAILATGGSIETAEKILLEELEGINARKDCSDFHLIMVLQIMKLFGEQLSEAVKAVIKQVLLDFRYWIDEPGNDVMWFFSENHALIFHICQYYAGVLFPNEVFTNSGMTGKEQIEKSEMLLEEWFGSFFQEFITEWNSNAYIPVDVLGLCGLYNLTEEGSKWNQEAKKALDWIFRDMAINEHNGAIMTTFGRSYEKESKGNYAAGTTSLLYIAYGVGNLNRAALAYTSFALGMYTPPEEYKQYIGLENGQALIYEKTQGYKNHVNLYLYKNSRVQLSTAVAFHPFTPGYQEHIMQATLDMTAQIYVTHPGEVQPYGNGRPNYWSGNGSLPLAVQWEDVGIMVYHIPKDHPVSYTHAYIPLMEFDHYIGTEHVVACEKNGGYLGVKSLNSLTMQERGACRDREFISLGVDNIWLLKVGTKEQYGSLEAFAKTLVDTEIRWTEAGGVKVEEASGRRFELPTNDSVGDCRGTITWIKDLNEQEET